MSGDLDQRVHDILEGDGPEGMYDDYDQACMWAGLVRELMGEVKKWRAAAVFAHDDNGALQAARSELEENEGVIRALRRQRDEAEQKLAGYRGDCRQLSAD